MFKKDIAIDLGTANILVYIKGKGIVINEPSVVAINTKTNTIYKTGQEAKEMVGRTPGEIVALYPLKDGVIADFTATAAMLKHFIKKANNNNFSKPRVLIAIPTGVTEVEKRAVEEAALQAGASEVHLIDEPKAAAIGANLPIDQPVGSMIVDIGGGTSEIAVISLDGIVTSVSVRTAGNEFDEFIVNYFKKEHNMLIGNITAEEVKIKMASAMPYEDEDDEVMTLRGRDLLTGLPKNIDIRPYQIREALKEPISIIIDGIKQTLEKTPPELASDIIENGIVLSGGGAYIRNLDKLIEKETGIKTYVADEPYKCVALGAGKVLENLDFYNNALRRTQTFR